jgi:hypothetical protein
MGPHIGESFGIDLDAPNSSRFIIKVVVDEHLMPNIQENPDAPGFRGKISRR